MTEFIINSDQLEQLIEGIEHKTDREINRVVCNDKELPSIVRCRDCLHYSGYSASHAKEEIGTCNLGLEWTELYSLVEPDGFCAWGTKTDFVTCKCGEDIERIGRIQVCPSCGRKVMA